VKTKSLVAAGVGACAVAIALAPPPAAPAPLATCNVGLDERIAPGSPGPNNLSLRVAPIRGLRSNHPVSWQLAIRNTARRPAGIKFLSAQLADVVLVDRSEQVYRWSARRVFAQPLLRRTLGARSTWSCVLPESLLDVPPGRYQLIARLHTLTGRPSFRRYVDVAG
jgi:Intracellular proteinase inhibitor